MTENDVHAWLLESDPAVRWQTERDLLDLAEAEWAATRARTATEGWGRACSNTRIPKAPGRAACTRPSGRRRRTRLLQLRRLGLPAGDAQAIAGARRLLDGASWVGGGVSYWRSGLAERCVNGMVLSIAAYFDTGDDRIDDIAALLLAVQMADGGWNCRDHQGATHSSFHTTISVLEGLTSWQRRRTTAAAEEAIAAGHEFMLHHGLFRSHRTGEVIHPRWLRFSFPPRWHYDVLRGLDHLRDVGAAPDSRAGDALAAVHSARRPDGAWRVGPRYCGRHWFTMEDGRHPGRWNTLRALRVLRWWGDSA